MACGFWFNFGGQTCVSLNINNDGTAALSVGTPDIGGSRASMCLMAAEELGIPYDKSGRSSPTPAPSATTT